MPPQRQQPASFGSIMLQKEAPPGDNNRLRSKYAPIRVLIHKFEFRDEIDSPKQNFIRSPMGWVPRCATAVKSLTMPETCFSSGAWGSRGNTPGQTCAPYPRIRLGDECPKYSILPLSLEHLVWAACAAAQTTLPATYARGRLVIQVHREKAGCLLPRGAPLTEIRPPERYRR